jgi:hypothetical protein
MRRQVLLTGLALVLMAVAAFTLWKRDRRDFSCLDTAERVELTISFHHPDSPAIHAVAFEIAPGGAVIRRPPLTEPIAHRSAYEARALVKQLLAPISEWEPIDARPPNAELTMVLRCNGGREHVRELFSSERSTELRDCWQGFTTGPQPYIRLNCSNEWLKARRASDWRERDDRSVEIGYRVWGLLAALEAEASR